MKYLENHVAVRKHIPLPSGTASATISIPGPVIREYTVINQPFSPGPGAKIGQLNQAMSTCTVAIVELYHDIRARKILASKEWMHYRQIDPSLKPWSPSESIASVNPQVLEKDRFMQTNCFTSFWTGDHLTKQTPTTPQDTWMVYCYEYQRYEYADSKCVHLAAYLGSGFFRSHRDWAYVVILRGYKQTGRSFEPDRIELSHGCGNGFRQANDDQLHRGNAQCANVTSGDIEDTTSRITRLVPFSWWSRPQRCSRCTD